MAVSRLSLLTFRRSLNQWALLSQCYDKPPCKVPLMVRKDDGNSNIRCGLLQRSGDFQKSSTFLGALLADVYASDQSWLNVLLNRQASSLEKPIKIQFGEKFDIQQQGSLINMVVPSMFLRDHKVEFMEVPLGNALDEDNCHFYLDLNGESSRIAERWPTVSVKDSPKISEMPLFNELNSKLALEAVLRFIRDKSTVKSYLTDLELSNFTNFSKRLAAKIDNRRQIYADLGFAILKNLKENDSAFAESSSYQQQKEYALEDIEKWGRHAHSELQNQVVPLIQSFLNKHLSVRRIYTYSDTKFHLKIKQLIEEPFRELQMQNNLYELRGRQHMSTPLKAPLIDKQYLERKVSSVYNDVNKAIYQNFLKLQLPLIICSTLGYISEQFSLYSMGSLASLGIALGMQRVLSSWEVAAKKAQRSIYEDIRMNIEEENKQLVREVNDRFERENADQKRKLSIISALSSEHTSL